jgi:hypothetical protein
MNFLEFVEQVRYEAGREVGETRLDPDFFNDWSSPLVDALDPFIACQMPKAGR